MQGTALDAIYIYNYYWSAPDPRWPPQPRRARTAHAPHPAGPCPFKGHAARPRRKCPVSIPEVASPASNTGSSGRGRLARFPRGRCFPALCPAPPSLALCVLLRERLPLPSASFRIPRLSLPLRGELMVERECGPAGGALAAARRSARPTSGSLCPEGSGLFMARPRRARQEGGGGGAALPR